MKKSLLFLFLCLALNLQTLQAQTWDQIGNNIEGLQEEDRFGISVDFNSDANTLAIGAYAFNNPLSGGYAKIFDWNGSDWVQKGSTIFADSINDSFGINIAISDDGLTVAIPAVGNDFMGYGNGQLKVFKWNGVDWIQKGLSIYGNISNGSLGNSVSISSDGNTVACGANNPNGQVRIFDWNGGFWIQRGSDILGGSNDKFGSSCELSDNGNIIIIGATQYHFNGISPSYGYAEVYEWNGVDWVQRGTRIVGDSIGDRMGIDCEISSDGNTISVLASYNDANGIDAGQTKIFQWNGINWVQMGDDILGEGAGDAIGGASISLSANGLNIAVGASWNDDNGQNAGHTRIFNWNGSSWIQKGIDIGGESAGDKCGLRISLNDNGTRIATGSTANNDANSAAGHVRVFDFCSFLERTDSLVVCEPYTWIDGNTYTESNSTATYATPNIGACDSLINLKLTVNTAETDITADGITLNANQDNVIYQWLDCENDYTYLNNETNQNFIATSNGEYALEVINNNCIDTSICYSIMNVGLIKNEFENEILIYPNPTDGAFIIDLGSDYRQITTETYDINARLISSKIFKNNEPIRLSINTEAGLYFINIISENEIKARIKVLKQ